MAEKEPPLGRVDNFQTGPSHSEKITKIPVSHRLHIGFIYVTHGDGTLTSAAAYRLFKTGGFRR